MEFVIAAHALKIKLFGLYLCAGRRGGYLACGPQAGTLAGAGWGACWSGPFYLFLTRLKFPTKAIPITITMVANEEGLK